MFAIIALVVFVIAAVIGFLVASFSMAHLIAIVAVGLAFLALHVSLSVYWNGYVRRP